MASPPVLLAEMLSQHDRCGVKEEQDNHQDDDGRSREMLELFLRT
jgi:hypothetical protein